MKKIFVAVLILAFAGFCVYRNVQNQQLKEAKEQTRIEKQKSLNMDFHNYPVKNDPKQITKTVTQESYTNNTTPITLPKNLTTKSSGAKLSGTKIPDWVYDNTSSNDKYYSLINSQTNFVFMSYADCPIGQERKRIAANAIARAGAGSKFVNKVELVPKNTRIHATCRKTYQGNVCYAKQGETKEGTCKCAIHYLLSNCKTQFCIVNPEQRRIEFVQPDSDALTNKLRELKKNW